MASTTNTEDDKKNDLDTEFVQGNMLWRSIPNVIQLTVNNRADKDLERIQQAMRNKKMDDAIWKMLEERVVGMTALGPNGTHTKPVQLIGCNTSSTKILP